MKKSLSTIALILVFLIGFSLLLYPTFSDYWNSLHQSRAVASYVEQVSVLENDRYEQIWNDAVQYNQALSQASTHYELTEEESQLYETLLDPVGNGIMGYVDIPSLGISLPIYHGTDEAVLQKAIGHLEWTSLPTGGEDTHCVISGHRGLPSAKLFTDIDKLVCGDVFMLRVLDETLTYEVDEILTVEPSDAEALRIEKGKDLCTLVTCTPYGVNTHRLLVKAHRIETAEEASAVRVTADAVQIEPIAVAPILAVPMLLVLLILLLAKPKKT